MMAKQVLTVTLLAFVATSLVVSVLRMSGRYGRSPTVVPPQTAVERSGNTHSARSIQDSDARYVAIFFHAQHRCPTCKKIEAYSHEALRTEIENGRLVWRVADYTAPENSAIVDDFKVFTSTVVLVEQHDHKIVRGTNLEDVWNHTDDQSKFSSFQHVFGVVG